MRPKGGRTKGGEIKANDALISVQHRNHKEGGEVIQTHTSQNADRGAVRPDLPLYRNV